MISSSPLAVFGRESSLRKTARASSDWKSPSTLRAASTTAGFFSLSAAESASWKALVPSQSSRVWYAAARSCQRSLRR